MLDIQKNFWKPKIIVQKLSENKSVFDVQYLPRWFWHTLWNSIRRLILGYDLGGAVTGIKFKWVQHEYSTLEGLKESIIDICLNFKKIRFNIETDEREIWVNQSFSKIWKIYSWDLKLPSWVEVVNKDVYLFEITDNQLTFDYRIEKGYGYYSIEFLKRREEKSWESDLGLILIDNDFRLVDYVKYSVEEVLEDFIGWSKDRLILEIATIWDIITPEKILSFAWEVLSMYAKLFVFDENYVDYSVFVNLEEIKQENTTEFTALKTMPIDVLPLSERTRNALIKNGIEYVEDLEKKTKNELLVMKGLWKKAIDEIVQSLEDINKSLEW